MAAGNGFTVIVVLVLQPVGREKIIDVVPALTPPTTPVVSPAVATEVLELLQLPGPPGELLVSMMVPLTHTLGDDAVEGSGSGFTVTGAEARQPVGSV